MLTGWQTVAVTLGASGITGAVALLTAWIRGRQERGQLDRRLGHEREQQRQQLAHDREEEWRDRLVRAADDFSTGVEQAILGVRNVIETVRDKGDVATAVAEAKRRLHEVVARFARIKLLFGEGADAVAVAKDVLAELDLARGAAERVDPTFAWQKLEKVYGLHQQFNEKAFEMISKPTWRVGTSLELRSNVEGAPTPRAGE